MLNRRDYEHNIADDQLLLKQNGRGRTACHCDDMLTAVELYYQMAGNQLVLVRMRA